MAAPLEPTPSRDYNAIIIAAAAAAAAAIPLSPPHSPLPIPPPAGDAPDLRATCRLHGPRSLYSRNSDGYYSTFSPGCNGCPVGVHEELEHAAADRVRHLHAELRAIWATEYSRHTSERATAVATALRAAIIALDDISGIIIHPQQYAARMLAAHDIALELDDFLVEVAVRDPYITMRHHITDAMSRLRQSSQVTDPYSVGDPTDWPIWAAATEALTEAEDAAADDTY